MSSQLTREVLVNLMVRKVNWEKTKILAAEFDLTAQKLVAMWRAEGITETTGEEAAETMNEGSVAEATEQPEGEVVELTATDVGELPAEVVSAGEEATADETPVVEEATETAVEEPKVVEPVGEPKTDIELVSSPQREVKWLKAVVGDKTIWLTDRQRAGLRLIAQGGTLPADLRSQLGRKLLVADGGLTDVGREVLVAANAV